MNLVFSRVIRWNGRTWLINFFFDWSIFCVKECVTVFIFTFWSVDSVDQVCSVLCVNVVCLLHIFHYCNYCLFLFFIIIFLGFCFLLSVNTFSLGVTIIKLVTQFFIIFISVFSACCDICLTQLFVCLLVLFLFTI